MSRSFLVASFLILMITSCSRNNRYHTFEDYPVYEGNDLEMIYSPKLCKFKVWAPTADGVKLFLFDNGSEGGAYRTLDMKYDENGTWKIEIEEDLKGKFYTFQIKIGEKWMDETPGANVKATGLNGKRGAIIDFRDTDPDGWENDVRPTLKNFTDIVEYQVHIRDFSIAKCSGMKNKGKYLAFTEHDTKNDFGQLTGVDHLKELGITHIHLLPCYDFDSIDESTNKGVQKNFGYSPINFTVPEGSYATNAKDPKVRIIEFKRLIQTLHKNGIRVIMDVAYSHTSNPSTSNLNLLVPGYYYRHSTDSSLTDGTGYGNETASERPMMRKLMIESLLFWVSEYHVDGFNFLQMGAHDIETLNSIRDALDKIEPTIFLSGDGFVSPQSQLISDKRANSFNAEQFDFVAVQNKDFFRGIMDSIQLDSLKQVNYRSCIFGKDSINEFFKLGVLGATDHPQINLSKLANRTLFVNNPTQVVNYLSNCNELTVSDMVDLTKPVGASLDFQNRINKFLQSILFTSQGVISIHGGDELNRTLSGRIAAHEKLDSVSQINWNNKSSNMELFQFFQGMISLRKQHAALRIPTQEMIQQYTSFLEPSSPNVFGYLLLDHVNGDQWKDIIVLYNSNLYPVKVVIPAGQWNVVCHDSKINLNGLFQIQLKDTIFSVPGSSTSIMFDE